jgi:hypothetical protein
MLAGDKDEEEKAGRLASSRGLALIVLGISISLDELAVGFSIGLASLPVITVIAAIGLQAFAAAELGLAIGARIGERWREHAERVAGITLILLGAYGPRGAVRDHRRLGARPGPPQRPVPAGPRRAGRRPGENVSPERLTRHHDRGRNDHGQQQWGS